VCISLCTTVAHNTAQNSSGNFPSHAPQDHHRSDDIYWRGGQTHSVKGVTDNHFPWQDVSHRRFALSRTSACPDSLIISRTRRFPDNHFPGQTFPGHFIQIILNTLECSCSKIRRSDCATSQSHFNPTQSALFNCSLIETIGWRQLRSWGRYVYVG